MKPSFKSPSFPSSFCVNAALVAAALLLGRSSSHATDYQWNSASQTSWTTSTSWSPNGVPGVNDNVLSPLQVSTILVNANTEVNNFTWNWSGAADQAITTSNSASKSLIIHGNLDKSGSKLLTIRSSSTVNLLGLTVEGSVTAVDGISFGGNGGGQALASLSLGSLSLTNGVNQISVGATSGTAFITGALDLNGTAIVNLRQSTDTSPAVVPSGVLQVGSLTGGNGSTIIRANGNNAGGTAPSTGTLRISGASGLSTFDGVIANGSGASTANPLNSAVSVEKQGGVTQVFTRANTYGGGTTITAGTLLLNNPSGSGTGTGHITASGTGFIGGTGFVAPTGTNGLSFATGSGIDLTATAGLNSFTVNLTGTTGNATFDPGALFKFDLASGSTSDVLTFTGLNDTSAVAFNNNTVSVTNAAVGTYFLFSFSGGVDQADNYTGLLSDTVLGLGPNLSGSFIYAQDTILLDIVAVPEPGSALLAGLGVMMAAGLRRRQTRSGK